MAVFEKVQEIIVEELGKETDEVNKLLFDELDADSLMFSKLFRNRMNSTSN